MPSSVQFVEIDAPLDLVRATILDFAAYPDFLPDVLSAEPRALGLDAWEVAFEVHLVRDLRYTLRLRSPEPTQVRWELVEGAFLVNQGGWTLEALSSSRTRATYEVDVQMAIFVPGNIFRTLVERSLPDTLARFKAEAERRAAGR
jgi:uncharacterized membrane protein